MFFNFSFQMFLTLGNITPVTETLKLVLDYTKKRNLTIKRVHTIKALFC